MKSYRSVYAPCECHELMHEPIARWFQIFIKIKQACPPRHRNPTVGVKACPFLIQRPTDSTKGDMDTISIGRDAPRQQVQTEELKGSIYDVWTGSQPNQFILTTEAITSYAERKRTNPQDISIAIKNLEDATISIPIKNKDIDEDITKILLGKELDAFVKRKQMYCYNKATVYSVVLGHCTEAMKNRL